MIMQSVIYSKDNGLKTQKVLFTQIQLAQQFQHQKIVSCMGEMTRSSYIGDGSRIDVNWQDSNP